jgi:hypothetical protein
MFKRKTIPLPYYVRFAEGDDGDKGGGGGGDKGKQSSDKDLGFPRDTPVAEMDDKQQIAYWKYHSRKHEGTANSRSDYDDQKALADKWRAHEEANKKPEQKVVDDAVNAARAEELRKAAPRIVLAEFKSVAADEGVALSLVKLFLEDVDPLKYLNKDGEPDTEKIEKKVKALGENAGSKGKGNAGGRKREDTHQGYRKNDGATGIDNGRSLFAERNKKK